MKTNQLMSVAFSEGVVNVFHNTAMGDLTQLWKVGTIMRVNNGMAVPQLNNFLQSQSTKDFIEVCERKTGKPCIEVTGRGKNGRTWASIHMMIYAAEYLSTEFHFEVIDAFINNKILEWRDVSGDEFKALNIAIDNYLPNREEKSNKGIYINVARMLLKKVNPDLSSWNDASADELRDRATIENKLVTTLQLGLIKDWEHMKEIIEKI
jgi:hypothetical protein